MNDPSILRNTTHVDFIDKNLHNVQFVKVNSMPAVGDHLTAKYYVDQAISNSVVESTLVGNNQDNIFKIFNLAYIISFTLNNQAVNDNQVIKKPYVDQFHHGNDWSRQDLGIDFQNESNELVKNSQDNVFNDNNLTVLDSIKVIRELISEIEVSKENMLMMHYIKKL